MIKNLLPIDALLNDIVYSLKENNTLILQATPGAGKTTRVPPALLSVTDKKILVLEPRRIAARLSAQRVAEELGEQCGETVGYQVRFEKKESTSTRIKFITEGLFLRLLQSDASLEEVGCVVLDEFHERHLHTDVALMLVHLLQKTRRPDLRLVIMSATLETKSLSDYLPHAKLFVCETKNYPVTVEYLAADFLQKSLDLKVSVAIEKILKDFPIEKGHILVFLPGRFDIEKCARMLSDVTRRHDIRVHQLSADTSMADQHELFLNTTTRKIILATNVAETSITIEGVSFVVDSGLAKIAGHAAWSGFSTLELKPISKSACIQRSGRAGRTQAGHTVRLFSSYDYNLRPQFEVPEIQRAELSQTLLEIKNLISNTKMLALKENLFSQLPWFEFPAPSAVVGSTKLLSYLGALDTQDNLTDIGKFLCDFPLHPRLSRILYEGKKRNTFPQALLLVSLLNEGMIFKRNSESREATHSDIAVQMAFMAQSDVPFALKTEIKKVETFLKFMCSLAKIPVDRCYAPLSMHELTSLLFVGFPDRVCKFRPQEDRSKKNKFPEYTLCLGGGAVLMPSSSVGEEEFILAISADESLSKVQSHATQIYFCHGIEKSFLSNGPKEFIEEKTEVYWNAEKRAAVCAKRVYYGKVVLKEEVMFTHSQEVEDLLLSELKKTWPQPFLEDNSFEQFNARLRLAHENGFLKELSLIQEDELDLFLCLLCEGKKSFAKILERSCESYIEEYIGYDGMQKLNSLLPSHIVVGRGRKIPVHYEEGKPPSISSRLQDFFGTLKTPKVLNQTLSVVVHLLAPNMQSVQVTTDLAGFWERGYQEVRKELSRRYPRHPWPEDPKNSEPPELTVRKRKNN